MSAQIGALSANSFVRRLGICVGGMLVLAVMTGPPGTNAAPTSGFTGALKFPRLFWFLGAAALVFAIITASETFGPSARVWVHRTRASVSCA